jgi:hypothetical protein
VHGEQCPNAWQYSISSQPAPSIAAMTGSTSVMTANTASFRRLLPPRDWAKTEGLSMSTASQWYENKKDVPALQEFLSKLKAENIPRPFKGLTTDGFVLDKLFQYAPNEGAPTTRIVKSTKRLISILSPDQIKTTMFDSVDDDYMRIWSNPEFYVNPGTSRVHSAKCRY